MHVKQPLRAISVYIWYGLYKLDLYRTIYTKVQLPACNSQNTNVYRDPAVGTNKKKSNSNNKDNNNKKVAYVTVVVLTQLIHNLSVITDKKVYLAISLSDCLIVQQTCA